MGMTPTWTWMPSTCESTHPNTQKIFLCYAIVDVCLSSSCRCVENNIHILLLPAHTTHLLQVSDISVFGPFKRYVAAAFAAHRIKHPGAIGNTTMARLTRVPWEKATSEHNVKAGFQKAGIHPYNDKKITAQTYKQGLTERKLEDDTSRVHIPPAPPLPVFVLASSSSSPSSPPSPPPRVESLSDILSVPAPPSAPAQKKTKKRKLDTTFSVMVTEKEHVDNLRVQAEEKERKKKQKEERKIARETKKQAKQQQLQKKETKKKPAQNKKSLRMSCNKENINPNLPDPSLDPYG